MEKNITVLFEDQDVLVINKPAGVVTNQATTTREETLQEWFTDRQAGQDFPDNWLTLIPADFSDQYGTPEEIFAQRQGMVHRLDKQTSGAMVFAKHPGSLLHLLAQFRQRAVKKEYLALVHGQFRVERGRLSAPLGRSRQDRQKFAVAIDGRKAVTEYSVQQTFSGFDWQQLTAGVGEESGQAIRRQQRLYEQGFSLITCFPKTGRTHQIRVHMANERHPLAGDTKYVGRKRAKIDPLWCPRQFLHAAEVVLTHPRTGEKKEFSAPLPADLSQVLKYLA